MHTASALHAYLQLLIATFVAHRLPGAALPDGATDAYDDAYSGRESPTSTIANELGGLSGPSMGALDDRQLSLRRSPSPVAQPQRMPASPPRLELQDAAAEVPAPDVWQQVGVHLTATATCAARVLCGSRGDLGVPTGAL